MLTQATLLHVKPAPAEHEREHTADGRRIAYRLPDGTPVCVAPAGMECCRWLFHRSAGDSRRLIRRAGEYERRAV